MNFRIIVVIIAELYIFFGCIHVIGADNKKGHVVTPQRVDKTGRPVTPSVHPHSPRARHRDSKVYYKIQIEGQEYCLDLVSNSKLLNNASVVESHLPRMNGSLSSVVTKKYPSNCHFVGVVRGHPHSKVALSNCKGLMGYILLDDVLYLVEPQSNDTNTTDSGHPHHVYPHAMKPKQSQCHVKSGNDKLKRVPQVKSTRRTRDRPPGRYETRGHLRQLYMEILVVLDKTLIDFHSAMDLENYVMTCMNIAHTALRDGSFGAPLELVVVRMIRLETEDDEMNLAVSQDGEHTLEVFDAWAETVNIAHESHPNHHDLAILITRIDICLDNGTNCGLVGLTLLGCTCDLPTAAIIAEDNGLMLGYTIAHEIGHAMGMLHDSPDESGCNHLPYGDDYAVIMAYDMTMKMYGWSNCSREYLWAWLDTGAGECLYDEPVAPEKHVFTGILPGASYGTAYQCRETMGRDATDCSDVAVECNNMKCNVAGYGCIESHQGFADGTPCGDHMWCYRGKCINEGMRPKAVDGGWSSWGAWGDCSRTCGGGVAKKARFCDDPPPSNNGLYCFGPRLQYEICNTQACPNGQPSYRDVQCAEYNDWVNPDTNRTHVWTAAHSSSENPCELICQDENKAKIVMKSQASDGTHCYMGEHHICVSGVCKPVGCDMILESSAVEDQCGVCHGDGGSCTMQMEEMHFKKDTKSQLIVVVPKTAKYAIFEETSPTRSTFIVMQNKKKVLNGNKYGVTMVEQARLWLGTIRHKQELLKIRGHLSSDMSVYVAAFDDVTVKYAVSLPAPAPPAPTGGFTPTEQSSYKWNHIGWSECSVPCGPGTEISEAKCVHKDRGLVEDKYCLLDEKPPPLQQICEVRECEARWQLGEWLGCDCACAEENNTVMNERSVLCVQQVGAAEEKVIDDELCTSPKPEHLKNCTCAPVSEEPHIKRETRKSLPPKCEPKKKIKAENKTILNRNHQQNIKSIKETQGKLIIDYQNLNNTDLALEVEPGQKVKNGDFPEPQTDDNVVHVTGQSAIKLLQKIQRHGRKIMEKVRNATKH